MEARAAVGRGLGGSGDQRRPKDPNCENPLGVSKFPYPGQEGLYDDYQALGRDQSQTWPIHPHPLHLWKGSTITLGEV